MSKPLEHLGSQVAELDLTGLDDLTLNDLNELYNTYELMGGGGTVMQETSLLFAELVAQRLTRLPLETLGTMRAKDAIKLKNRIYRFFLHVGVGNPAEIKEARKACIFASKYTHTGLGFFFGLPLKTLNRTLLDISEAVKEERRLRSGNK